jgi:NADPH-dependent curcumin reductase CurA
MKMSWGGACRRDRSVPLPAFHTLAPAANRVYFAMQTYRPQIQLGDVMAGFAMGEVIESTDSRFKTLICA